MKIKHDINGLNLYKNYLINLIKRLDDEIKDNSIDNIDYKICLKRLYKKIEKDIKDSDKRIQMLS
jgi:hypothetical protein